MRILWLKTELLHPVDKGGRIRTYQMLREIRRQHEVTYLTLDDGDAAADAVDRSSEYASKLVRIPFDPPRKGTKAFYGALVGNLLSSLPYAIARYRSDAMKDAIATLAPSTDLVVCDFLAPAVNLPSTLAAPTVLFQHNVEAMIWERHAAVSANPVRRAYMREQFRRMHRFEKTTCQRLDHVIAVSPQDVTEMQQRYGAERLSSVATGVDLEYFDAGPLDEANPFEIVFTGSMDWMPNDDAMIWFLEGIMPLIRQQIPESVLTIVGRSPSERVRALASRLGGVEVTGRVPDVRPYMRRASAFVVPIRIGGGTRLKIFEAMAMGLPVISTSVGAEGLSVSNGETARLCDEPASFAQGVVSLLRSGGRSSMGEAGRQWVRQHFGWEGVAHTFMEQCAEVLEARQAVTGKHTLV
ncbi:MAG: glycosyltransferase [Gemmatimonas sp.]